MVDRLARAIQHVNELPEAVQEEIALHIEELLTPISETNTIQDFAGIWQDLQGDDEFAALDRMRHEVPPTPPIEEE
jgi:hypothetical protein